MRRIEECLAKDGETVSELVGRNGDDACGVDAVRRGIWRNVDDGDDIKGVIVVVVDEEEEGS